VNNDGVTDPSRAVTSHIPVHVLRPAAEHERAALDPRRDRDRNTSHRKREARERASKEVR